MINYLYFFLIITFLFIIYIEYSVGNILFRHNSLGTKSINIPSLLNYLIDPLKSSFLWNIKCLDINYIFIISIYSILYFII
jgi:hypothetical protein